MATFQTKTLAQPMPAVQFDGTNFAECVAFLGMAGRISGPVKLPALFIARADGLRRVATGEWIVPGADAGHFYTLKPADFAALFEAV